MCLSEAAWPTHRVAQTLYTHATVKQIIYYSLWIIICIWRPADPSGRKMWVCGRSRFGIAGSNPAEDFLFFELQTASAAHPGSCWMDAGPLSTRVKRPVREVNKWPPFSAVFKNEWNDTSSPPIHLYGVDRESSAFLSCANFWLNVSLKETIAVQTSFKSRYFIEGTEEKYKNLRIARN